jgi:hypothetical protein
MKALAPEVSDRYQRAGELLDDLATSAEIDHNATEMEDIRRRLRARDVPKRGFCWHCRKPLHARSETCAFCGESSNALGDRLRRARGPLDRSDRSATPWLVIQRGR